MFSLPSRESDAGPLWIRHGLWEAYDEDDDRDEYDEREEDDEAE